MLYVDISVRRVVDSQIKRGIYLTEENSFHMPMTRAAAAAANMHDLEKN
jgi:adenylate kinase